MPSPTSERLQGEVAVGLIIVSGPGHLAILPDEMDEIVARMQEGCSILQAAAPAGDVVFNHEIHPVYLSLPDARATQDHDATEAPWRDAALAQIGQRGGRAGVLAYVTDLRRRLGTRWAYCAFVTKYSLTHFAYAWMDGPHLVLAAEPGHGWSQADLDVLFAHETCHIFGAPDEYKSSGCNCGTTHGVYGHANLNCQNCVPNGGELCIMHTNVKRLCDHTKRHVGFSAPPGGWPSA